MKKHSSCLQTLQRLGAYTPLATHSTFNKDSMSYFTLNHYADTSDHSTNSSTNKFSTSSSSSQHTSPYDISHIQKQNQYSMDKFLRMNTSSKQYTMDVSHFELPHPDKIDKGGEDSSFISKDKQSFGVADGVGGWIELGIDPSLYSKALMQFCKEKLEYDENASLSQVLDYAYEETIEEQIRGSTTACICKLNGSTLHTLNIGDSAILIIRNGEVIYRSEEQTHSFNYPYQLGLNCDKTDVAVSVDIDVQPEDIVIVATDGIFDNLFDNDILQIVAKNKHQSNLAEILTREAQSVSLSSNVITPFSERLADELDNIWDGGKLDDITCIVTHIKE